MKSRRISIIDFVTDPELLGLSISKPQETLLRAIYGMPLTKSQREIWKLCTGRESYPRHGFSEATVICGARAGKDSRIATPIAAYESCFGGHERELSRGEYGTVALVAQDSRAVRIAFNYLRDYFLGSKLLKSMLVDEPLSNEIKLRNKITISCFPSTLASLRGWSIPVGILDEVGFWRLEGSADSDVEIQASVRRGMVNFARSKLIKISSPFMRSGVLHDDYKNHYTADSPDILVWRASSTFMNPTLRDSKLESQRRLDPQRFAREYLAEFYDDLETFLPNVWIESAIIQGRYELPAQPSCRYAAGVDVTGLGSGKGADAFTLSVGHYAGDIFVLDFIKGWRKGRSNTIDLGGITAEISSILKRYSIHDVDGDRYSGQWVVEAFRKVGVNYHQLDKDKSFYYLEMEPLFAQGKIEVLDNAELLHELRFLERRARQGGKAVIDHPQRGHDDYSNSLAIACAKAKKASMTYGYPVGPTRRNPFGVSVPRGGTDDMPAPGISAPIAVGNTGTSLGWLRNDDDDYYVGAKPVR